MGVTVNLADYDELVKISERASVLRRLYRNCLIRNTYCVDEEKLTGLPFETIALVMGWEDGTDDES